MDRVVMVGLALLALGAVATLTEERGQVFPVLATGVLICDVGPASAGCEWVTVTP